MPTPTQARRGPLTRDAIVATARELVVSEGADAISLRGVGRRLGVTAPALCADVEDREDLLRAVAQDGLAQRGERFDSIVTDGPVDRLRLFEQPEDTLVASLAMWAGMLGAGTILTMGFGFDGTTRDRIIDKTIGGAVAALGVGGSTSGQRER